MFQSSLVDISEYEFTHIQLGILHNQDGGVLVDFARHLADVIGNKATDDQDTHQQKAVDDQVHLHQSVITSQSCDDAVYDLHTDGSDGVHVLREVVEEVQAFLEAF